jgi:YD repeat-containing protein
MRNARCQGGTVLAVLGLLLMGAWPVAAQDEPGDVGGFTRFGHFPSFLPFEYLDTQSAHVMVRFNVLALPGNRHHDLVITSHLRLAGIPMSVQEGIINTGYLLPADILDLWQVLRSVGPQLVMGDGSSRRMYFETWPRPSPLIPDPETGVDPTYRYSVSTDRLRYDAATKVVHRPDGVQCHYGQATPFGWRHVTSCADAFGPFLSVSYPEGGHWASPGIKHVRHILEGTVEAPVQYREIEFETTLLGGGSSVTEMRYEGRTWRLESNVGSSQTELHTPEISTPWTFQYQNHISVVTPSVQERLLTRVRTPGGAQIDYTYAEKMEGQPASPPWPASWQTYGWYLTSRSVSGGDTASGTWTNGSFDIASGTNLVSFGLSHPGAGAAGLPTTYISAHAHTLFTGEGLNEGLVGPLLVPTDQWTPVSRRSTTYKRVALVHYPAGVMFPPAWGEYTLMTLVPDIISEVLCDPPASAACVTYERDHETYDAFGNLTRLVQRSTSRPGIERVTQTTYVNQAGYGDLYLVGLPQVSTVTVGTNSVTTTRTYNVTTGFLTGITAAGVQTTFAPDSHGNVATRTVAPGTSSAQATTYTYDWGVAKTETTAAGTVHRTINPDGTVAAETQGYGSTHPRTTQFQYDALGRIRVATPPGGGTTTFTDYDTSAGRWMTATRGTVRARTDFDGLGRPLLSLAGTTSAWVSKASTSYYPDGRVHCDGLVVAANAPTFPCTLIVYDDVNGVVTHTLPDQASRSRRYDVVDGAVKTTLTDENGHTTVSTHRGFAPPGAEPIATLVDAAAQTWTYSYDDVTGDLAQVAAPNGVTRSWTFQPGTKRLASESHPESGTVEYLEYWPSGLLKKSKDANQTEFEYAYDGAGRLTEVKTTRSGSVERTIINHEDGSDLVVATRWPNDTTPQVAAALSYDTAGRFAGRADTIDGKTFSAQYTYDDRDNLTSITYPSGRLVRYGYDAADRLVAICRASASLCDATTPLAETYARAFEYEPSGALKAYTAGNGVVTTLTYDASRQWLRTITAVSGGTRLDLTYDYDPVGNVLGVTDGTHAAWTQTFTYDALDRLRTAAAPAYGTSAWTYDAHGNRQTGGAAIDGGGGTLVGSLPYTYYAANRFRLERMGATGPTLSYDTNGNLTGISNNSFQYAYTRDNQLRTATAGGVTTEYAYDADQWRVKKATANQPVMYYMRGPGGALLSEWTNGPSPTATARDYIYADGRLVTIITSQEEAK